MNRTALTIQMLLLLKSRGLMKKQEIADELEVKVRNIIEFKRELENAGYYIESIPGQQGGYLLKDAAFFPLAQLSAQQKESLVLAKDYLLNSQHPLFNRTFKQAYQQLIANEATETSISLNISPQSSVPLERIEEHISQLSLAISQKLRIKIEYQRGLIESKTYVFEPYHILEINQAFYTIGYLKAGDVTTFRIDRMLNIEVLDEKYAFDNYFNLNQEIDEFGFRFDEIIDLKLEVIGQPHYAQRIYGDQQKVTILNDQDFILEVKTRGKIATLRMVLEMGGDVKVLQPQWLIESIKQHYQKISTYYD